MNTTPRRRILERKWLGPTQGSLRAEQAPPRRARGAADKAARRLAILAAAGDLFEEAHGELPSVEQVARRAGLAKGTVYLYFGAKEEMFLALLSAELRDWFESLSAMLLRRLRER